MELDDDGNRRWVYTTKPGPIYYKSNDETDIKSIYGENLTELEFDNIRHLRKFLRETPEAKTNLYGTTRHAFGAVANRGYEEATVDDYRWTGFDIETEVGEEFAEPAFAEQRVNMITLKSSHLDHYDVWTIYDMSHEEVAAEVTKHTGIPADNLKIVTGLTEEQLLWKYVNYFKDNMINVYGGWNSMKYDVFYMCNRIKRILGHEALLQMSPFGVVEEKDTYDNFGKDLTEFKIRGLDHVDFQELYKKRTFKYPESFSLDNIANDELHCGKLHHESGVPGHLLYDFGFKEAGMAYNVVDVVRLVQVIEASGIFKLEAMLAQMTKQNLSDTIFVTRVILAYAYNFLKLTNEVMPLETGETPFYDIEGGYVQPVVTGRHRYIASSDLASSYPSNMRALNISPETKGPKLKYHNADGSVRDLHEDDLIAGYRPPELSDPEFLEKYTFCPNGQCFIRSRRGFFPRMLDGLYDLRNTYKFEANRLNALYAETKNIKHLDAAKSTKEQDKVVKMILNSVFGAITSANFLFSDSDVGGAITAAGRYDVKEMKLFIERFSNNEANMVKSLKMYCKHQGLNYADIAPEKFEPFVATCIAIDTDSNYFTYSQFIDQLQFEEDDELDRVAKLDFLVWFGDNIMQKPINKAMSHVENVMNSLVPNLIKADREIIAYSGVWVAKKSYTLLAYDVEGARFYPDYYNKTMGMSFIRSVVSQRSKDAMKEFVKVLLLEGGKASYNVILDYRKEFDDLDHEAIARNGVSKNFEAFATDDWAVCKIQKTNDVGKTRMQGPTASGRAAIAHNRFVKEHNLQRKVPYLHDGDSLRIVQMRTPNPVGDNIFAWSGEFPDEFKKANLKDYFDYDSQFEKSFFSQADLIYTAMGYQPDVLEELDLF